jgi:group I intron endonuclease
VPKGQRVRPDLAVRSAVYLVAHRASGRVYVGMTRQQVSLRWRQHVHDSRERRVNSHFGSAIAAHGEDAFDVFVLESAVHSDALADRERHFIKVFRSNERGRGFNLTSGGDVGWALGEDARAKIAASSAGRTPSQETRAKISAALTGFVRSAEEVEKSAVWRRGSKASEETRAKLRAAHTGKQHSEETKRRMSESHRERMRDDTIREVAAERMRQQWLDPEFRARTMAAHASGVLQAVESGRYKDAAARRVYTPELRAKYRAAALKRWANKQAA